MKHIPLIIFGAGSVGRALVRQLIAATPEHARREGLAFDIVAWCDSNGAVLDESGIPAGTLTALDAAKASGVTLAETEWGSPQGDLRGVLDVAGTDGCIVVDVTASRDTIPALELALERGYGLALANKVPLAGDQALFDRLMMGRDALRVHSRLRRAGDRDGACVGARRRSRGARAGCVERHAGLSLHRSGGRAALLTTGDRSDATRVYGA